MTIKENYETILKNISKACVRSRRDPHQIKIMGVVKAQSSDSIREAYDCGIRLIGENKTQEADLHQTELKDLDIEWHFIGKLQKNKINRILNTFQFIQSVDGVKSLEHIHKRVTELTDIFIEINIGEEKSKSGFTVSGLKKALTYLKSLNKVRISGIMSIPPYSDDIENTRLYFQQLRALKDEINAMKLPNFQISELSMGMSHDYEMAVEEGATIVRIGSALFGRRTK
jgi:pyridoxal phosphate enzyme (YggS family)